MFTKVNFYPGMMQFSAENREAARNREAECGYYRPARVCAT